VHGLSQDRVRRLIALAHGPGTPLSALPEGWRSMLPEGAPLNSPVRWRQVFAQGGDTTKPVEMVLRTYIWNKHDAMIDYGRRWREGKPISRSRAEILVNNLVNARMNKRRQMRWSPRGAHRVLRVRAAVLDNRFHTAINGIAA